MKKAILKVTALAIAVIGSISIMSCEKEEGTTVPPENNIEMEEHEVLPLCVKLFCEGKITKCGRHVRVEL